MLYPLSYGGSGAEPSAPRGSIVHHGRAAPTLRAQTVCGRTGLCATA
jgi:hypothetical protein